MNKLQRKYYSLYDNITINTYQYGQNKISSSKAYKSEIPRPHKLYKRERAAYFE